MQTLALIWITLGTGAAMAIEEPPFKVVRSNADYEIRAYPKILVAETEVEGAFEEAGNRAFRILADYIFGKNQSKRKLGSTGVIGEAPKPVNEKPGSEKIAMTAPVGMEKSQAGYRVQFTLPAGLTLETAPEPLDARVKIRELPARTLAVHRYSGSWSEERFRSKLSEFEASLKRDRIKTSGEAHFARFNSPFALWFLRRNEIWLEVAPSLEPAGGL